MDNKNIVFIKTKINEFHFLCNQIDISTIRSRIDGGGGGGGQKNKGVLINGGGGGKIHKI